MDQYWLDDFTTTEDALSVDLSRIDLAHRALDELGVPRTSNGGHLTIFGRIEALRAGKFDPQRLTIPAAPETEHKCPRCGLLAPLEAGVVCTSCAAELARLP